MNILQVMRAPVGGLFRHVADLTRALAERGHSVALLVDSLASDAQTKSRLDALAPYARLGIFRTQMPRLAGPGDVVAPLKVRGLVGRLAIDVVHGHGAKGGFYARLAGVRQPVFYTPHGGVLHYPQSSPVGRSFHWLERRLMARSAGIIFESAFAAGAYAGIIGTPTCPTMVVHNGLAPEEFYPVEPGEDAADFVYVGELRDLKGVFVLVEALAGITGRNGPATLVMAGDGPARGAIEMRIAALGLEDRVTLAGVQPARAMFARGRIMVVPSLAESLPYVVLEAAAAFRPVIATNVGGIPEIFGAQAGRLVPPGDVSALMGAMQTALDAPEALARESAILRERVQAQFSVDAMTSAIEQLYAGARNVSAL